MPAVEVVPAVPFEAPPLDEPAPVLMPAPPDELEPPTASVPPPLEPILLLPPIPPEGVPIAESLDPQGRSGCGLRQELLQPEAHIAATNSGRAARPQRTQNLMAKA
jgi:hypothetical protein